MAAPLSIAQAATPTEPAPNASLDSCLAELVVPTHALSPIATPATLKVNAVPALLDFSPALMALLALPVVTLLAARVVNPPKIVQFAPQA